MTHNNLTASDIFVQALEQEGVEYIYGIPGEENIPLLESIRKSNIKLILTRHEQGAAFMAATYGRLTGKPGVAISTLGPGATNFTTSAAYATLGGFPLVLITGQKPITHSKQGKFQIIDVVAMMKPITKLAKQISHPNMVSSSIREAFKIATQEKQGCVHLEFPEDISEMPAEKAQPKLVLEKKLTAGVNPLAIEEASKIIKASKCPLLLIGSAASNNVAKKYLTEFVNQTGMPFFTTQMGKGVIAEDNPLFLGTAALTTKDYLHDALNHCDLIINIGYDLAEKPAYLVNDFNKTRIININYFPAVADNIYQPILDIEGDINLVIEELGKHLGKLNHDFSKIKKIKKIVDDKISETNNNTDFPVKPQRLVADLNKYMGKEDIISLDNGTYKIWFARNYKCYNPNTLLLDNALATMGAGLPGAMEAARINPDKKVIAVVGDGGFMMNSQELMTAVELNLNLVVLIVNDGSYGMIKWKQDGMSYPVFGLDFKNPDFVKYAQSYGAAGHRLNKTEDLTNLLDKCFQAKGVHLIDVPVDYSENKKVLTDELNHRKKGEL